MQTHCALLQLHRGCASQIGASGCSTLRWRAAVSGLSRSAANSWLLGWRCHCAAISPLARSKSGWLRQLTRAGWRCRSSVAERGRSQLTRQLSSVGLNEFERRNETQRGAAKALHGSQLQSARGWRDAQLALLPASAIASSADHETDWLSGIEFSDADAQLLARKRCRRGTKMRERKETRSTKAELASPRDEREKNSRVQADRE